MHFCLDLVDLIGVLSWYCSNLGPLYIKLVKHVLYYIFGILHLSLIFDEKADTSNNVIKFIDSDLAELKPN